LSLGRAALHASGRQRIIFDIQMQNVEQTTRVATGQLPAGRRLMYLSHPSSPLPELHRA